MNRSAALGFLVGVAIAAPTLSFDLPKWDDDRYLTYNPIREESLGACLAWAVREPHFQSYHPVHHLLICAELAADGPAHPFVLHFVSTLLAGLTGALLVLWLRREGVGAFASVITSTLFLGHPILSETLASVPSQKDLLGLSFGFGMLAIAAQQTRPSRRATAWMVTLLALATWSKSGYAVFGLIVPLRDVYLAETPLKETVARRWHLTAIAGALFAHAAYVVIGSGLPPRDAAWFDPALVGATAFHYARSLVVPWNLVPYQCLDRSLVTTLAGWGVLAAVTAPMFVRRRGFLALAAAIAFFGSLPYLNIVPAPLLVTNRFAIMAVLGVALAFLELRERPRLRLPLALLAGGLLVLGWVQQRIWQDGLTLWRATAETSRCDHLPQTNLSVAEFNQGNRDAAEDALFEAMRLDPKRGKTYRDLVLAFLLSGDCGPATPAAEAERVGHQLVQAKDGAKLAEERKLLATAAVLALHEAHVEPQRALYARALWARLRLDVERCSPRRAKRIASAYGDL